MSLISTQGCELAGLDIGSSAVKIAKLKRKGRRYILTALESLTIKRSNSNQQQQIRRTISIIRRCLNSINTHNVACAVSGQGVIVRQFEFPSISTKHIGEAVRMEATQVCPFSIEDSIIDYHVLKTNEDRGTRQQSSKMKKKNVVGILAVATNEAIKQTQTLVNSAGASCVTMDVVGLALLNCLIACEGYLKKQTTMVMNVGSSYTNVAIVSKNGMPFVRDITYAADHIISRICDRKGLDAKTVTDSLFKSEETKTNSHTVKLGLRTACAELANEITDTIHYYSINSPEEKIEKIYLCGGFSQAAGFAEEIGKQLTIPLEILNPIDRLSRSYMIRKNKRFKKIGPSFAVAIGLAMRSG